jgi:hypothetical protein
VTTMPWNKSFHAFNNMKPALTTFQKFSTRRLFKGTAWVG